MGRYKIRRDGPQNRAERRAAARGKTGEASDIIHRQKGRPALRKYPENETPEEES